jgi:hypothetical protein
MTTHSMNNNFKKIFYLFILIGLLSSSCGQIKNDKKNIKEEPGNELILESLFFYSSVNELQEKFGKFNVLNEFNEACETCGPEGSPLEESFYTTTLFPNSKKEVIIEWDSNQTTITRVTVESEANEWRTKEGFKIGNEITKIKSYFKNNPFEMLYFYEFMFSVNDSYKLYFNADLNFTPFEAEIFQSSDSRLEKLVLKRIELKLPGYEK